MIRDVAVMMGQGKHVEKEVQYRREICKVGRWIYRLRFVVASEGNLSVRLDADRILITPAGACKGRLLLAQLMITDLEGKVVPERGVTCGPDLITAYQHMETVEHLARVMLTAESLGGPRLLTRTDVQKLMAAKHGSRNLGPGRQVSVLAAKMEEIYYG